jgi:signal transduction protein with GAF and PtsI domain
MKSSLKCQGLKNPQSQLAIPLLIQEQLIGVLSVESETVNTFKLEDEQILKLIANQAAIAINNARLYEDERKRFHEIEDINARLSALTQTQQQTLNLFMKYVPETVVKKALRENPETMFEGDQLEVALLFCDIRDFTPLSEQLTPTQVVTVLNTFYSLMNDGDPEA